MAATPAETITYVRTVFQPDDLVELRVFLGRDPRGRTWFRAGDVESENVGKFIQAARDRMMHVYAGVNPRKGRAGKGEDVALARWLFADIDKTTVENAMALVAGKGSSIPPPSMWVASGHGSHCYWRLDEPMHDLAAWSEAQAGIIRLLDSDPAAKDAPRIMRLPGTCNWKADPPVECVIHSRTDSVYSLADFKLPARPARPPGVSMQGSGITWRTLICRATMDFLLNGAPEGRRNTSLFKAACDMNGCGATFDEALDALMPVADRCGLDHGEAEGAIRSAFGKLRTPTRREETTPRVYSAFDAHGNLAPPPDHDSPASPQPSTVLADAPGDEQQPRPARMRPMISNVVRLPPKAPDEKPSILTKPIDQIDAEVREIANGWPARIGDMLFVPHDFDPEIAIPGLDSVWMLRNADALFAWFHTIADVSWVGDRNTATKNTRGASTSAQGKREMYERLVKTARPRYRAISVLPHEPPMRGVYYTPCVLPEATGEALDGLLAMFNPETEADRQLLLAALLTPGWGGEPGRRPPFVLSSEHGRGAGKTATATAIAEYVWGGALSVHEGESWEKVLGRLLGNDGLSVRCVLWDNIKGRLSGSGIEGLITSSTIDGWRPHYGQFSRPNDMTYFFTANVVRLSTDLASRSVEIKIGKQRHGQAFVSECAKYVGANRPAILADIYARLREPPRGAVSSANRDRWQDWQDSVLCRCDDPDRLAGLIISRRLEIDDDQEDATRVADAIRQYLKGKGQASGVAYIGKSELRDELVRVGVTDAKFSTKGVSQWVRGMMGDAGPLRALSDERTSTIRRWAWDWRRDRRGDDQPVLDAVADYDGEIPI